MYTPLYIKTHNSLLSSMITIDKLIIFAKKNNIKALTITDNNMYGAMDFYYACKKNNIKPIIGLEINLDTNIVLYCQNYQGYQNLIKLATIQSEEKITIDLLTKYNNDILCIVPYESLNNYNNLSKIYKYIFKSYKNKEEHNIVKDGIYMNEILYLQKDDAQYLKYLYAIRDGKIADEELITTFNNHLFLPNINNELISDLCNLKIEIHKDLLPVYPCSTDAYTFLKQLCINGLKKLFGTVVNKKYVERLKYELKIIKELNFCNYFLVVHDYVKFAKEKGILVGPGRGSAAGSLVAYCLNITTIDPIKYNLLFERFLNPDRITMPDIDIDFEYNRRWEVIQYCIEKYGLKKVAPIITFGTLGAKQVLRDVGRVMDTNIKQVDILCKEINPKLTLKENYKNNVKIANILKYNPQLEKVFKISLKFEGLKRHTSIHAAGIVMSQYELDDIIPLKKTHDGFYITGYSMDYLENIGLLKMDFLALKNLTLITDVLSQINNLTFDTIIENDNKALNIFTTANTIGIFQFESTGMINFLKKFKPNTFEDIFAAIALYRPGPMQNIDSYIRRKQGKEKIDYIDPSLEKILKPTYGIIIYQEQIMQIAHVLANYSLSEADLLRRAMSKKKEEILLKQKEEFIKRSVKNGYNESVALKVYNLILKFASYGFNRAHSVAYSMISYKMAYLKAYYPKQFMKSLLSMVIGSEIKTKEYIYECKMNNINILPPDINKSTNDYIITKTGIRFPLNNVKNLGLNSVKMILEARTHSFKDIYDFVGKCYPKAVNRKTLENLILIGAFDSMNINRKTLFDNLDVILNYGEIGSYLDDSLGLKPEIENKQEFTDTELMNFEHEIYGFYLSNHPITKYKIAYNSISIKQLHSYFNQNINIVIYVDKMKGINTKKNEKMLFITGSDEVNIIDVVLFPKTYLNNSNIEVGDIILLNAKVEKRFDKLQLIANKIKVLNKS